MRRGRLASCLLILATAASIAAMVAVSSQASGPTGWWSKAAGLITGREEHTATLLPNGDVLVAGGTNGRDTALDSAEIYHPATNRWTPARPMAAARYDHTATLLPNGKVLVVGGLAGPIPFGSLATSELYDPTTGAWSRAAPMILSRARHTATLLADGRVLVVGGLSLVVQQGGLFPSQATDAEIYDPAADRWSATAPMGQYRLDQTATRLTDGRVLIAGGQDGGNTFNSTEIYNAVDDRWISAAPMGARRDGQAAVLLPDGDVLVVGGTGEEPSAPGVPLSSAELYDPNTNQWVTITGMAAVHREHTATLLRTGAVLVVGSTAKSQPELYDLGGNAWSTTGSSMDRYQHTATLLLSGKVLIAGGYGIESLDSVLLYDPNGLGPPPRQAPDVGLIGEFLLVGLVAAASIALFIPAVRKRLRNWRSHPAQDEWIS
jgi:N-acetylneuraminic acid mutarotase